MTAQQKRLLDFIREQVTRTGISPSYDEMMRHMGLRSKSGIHRLVHGLIARGHLCREGYARGITLPSQNLDWERMRALIARGCLMTHGELDELQAIFKRLDHQTVKQGIAA
jgi:SOS-response transcriptional repressor LexA